MEPTYQRSPFDEVFGRNRSLPPFGVTRLYLSANPCINCHDRVGLIKEALAANRGRKNKDLISDELTLEGLRESDFLHEYYKNHFDIDLYSYRSLINFTNGKTRDVKKIPRIHQSLDIYISKVAPHLFPFEYLPDDDERIIIEGLYLRFSGLPLYDSENYSPDLKPFDLKTRGTLAKFLDVFKSHNKRYKRINERVAKERSKLNGSQEPYGTIDLDSDEFAVLYTDIEGHLFKDGKSLEFDLALLALKVKLEIASLNSKFEKIYDKCATLFENIALSGAFTSDGLPDKSFSNTVLAQIKDSFHTLEEEFLRVYTTLNNTLEDLKEYDHIFPVGFSKKEIAEENAWLIYLYFRTVHALAAMWIFRPPLGRLHEQVENSKGERTRCFYELIMDRLIRSGYRNTMQEKTRELCAEEFGSDITGFTALAALLSQAPTPFEWMMYDYWSGGDRPSREGIEEFKSFWSTLIDRMKAMESG